MKSKNEIEVEIERLVSVKEALLTRKPIPNFFNTNKKEVLVFKKDIETIEICIDRLEWAIDKKKKKPIKEKAAVWCTCDRPVAKEIHPCTCISCKGTISMSKYPYSIV